MGAKRLVGAVCSGLGALVVVVCAIGLLWAPVGAADNGDGFRLYCGAGLTPLTGDGASNWKGGVVLDFAATQPPCPDPQVSSALTALRIASAGAGEHWSLTALGGLYAAGIALATAAAAWLVLGSGPSRLLVLVPALVPLAVPAVSRFFVSTYTEPAGLFGACLLLLGAGVLGVVPRPQRAERIAGIVLTAAGGIVAATAKPSYAPLVVVAAVLCVTAAVQLTDRPRRRDLLPGAVAALLAVGLAAGPVIYGLRWQNRTYAAVNTHNLVFTLVLPALGPGATGALGLPAGSAAFAGRAYYPEGSTGNPASDVIAEHPLRVRGAALRLLLEHPGTAVGALGTGLTATLGAQLSYLPAEPVGPATRPVALGTTVGEQGADRRQLLDWLDGLPVPWLPVVLVAAGLIAAVLTRRSAGTAVRALGRVAGTAAVSAVLITAVAVLGDGYFEIAKHVWLAAYCLGVTLVAIVLATVVALVTSRATPAAQPGQDRSHDAPAHP